MKNITEKTTKIVAAMLMVVSALVGCTNKKTDQKVSKEDIGDTSISQHEPSSEINERSEDTKQNSNQQTETEDVLVTSEKEGAMIVKQEKVESGNTPQKTPSSEEQASKEPTQDKQEQVNKPQEEGKQVEVSSLQSMVEQCQGLDATGYLSDSYQALLIVQEEAASLLLQDTKTQVQVDTMLTKLETAYRGLMKKADQRLVHNMIKELQGYDVARYTSGSYEALSKLLHRVEILENTEVSLDAFALLQAQKKTILAQLEERGDVKELRDLLKRVAALEKDLYIKQSYDSLMAIFQQIHIDDPTMNQAQVDQLYQKLYKAMTAVELYQQPDLTQYQTVLQRAIAVVEKEWSDASYQVLQQTIKEAQVLASSYQVTQQQIETATSMVSNALTSLTVDTASLHSLLMDAKRIESNDYTDASISEVNRVCGLVEDFLKETHPQYEVDAMREQLEKALEALEVVKELDKTALKEALLQAKEVTEAMYTPSSYTTLKQATENAELVLRNKKATQLQMEAAITNLELAMSQLVEKADTTALDQVILEAKEKAEAQYMSEGFKKLTRKVSEAQSIQSNQEASQSQVDEVASALRQLLNELVEKGDVSELNNILKSYQSIDASAYTKSSYAQLETILKDIEAKISQEFSKKTQEDWVSALNTAKQGLVKKADCHVLQQRMNAIHQDDLKRYYTADSLTTLQGFLQETKNKLQQGEVSEEMLNTLLNQLDKNLAELVVSDTVGSVVYQRITDAKHKDARAYQKEGITALHQLATSYETAMQSPVSEEDLHTMRSNLEIAFTYLVLDQTQLQSVVTALDAKNLSGYTSESIAVLQAALVNAKQVLSTAKLTEEAIIQAIDQLETAEKGLVEVVEQSLKEQLDVALLAGEEKTKDYIANAFTDESYQRYAKATYDVKQFLSSLEQGFVDLDTPQDKETANTLLAELEKSIEELTLYEGNKPEDQAFIDMLQAAIDRGELALTNDYDDMNEKALHMQMDQARNTIKEISEKTVSYPHNAAGTSMIQESVQQIEEAIAQLSKEVEVIAPSVETDVVNLMNANRVATGLPEVQIDQTLSKMAYQRALEMSRYLYLEDKSFSEYAHMRPDGTKFSTIFEEYGYQNAIRGENAALGYASAASIYQGWWKSSGHRDNMMDSRFNRIGVAIVKVGDGQYLGYMLLSNQDGAMTSISIQEGGEVQP